MTSKQLNQMFILLGTMHKNVANWQ